MCIKAVCSKDSSNCLCHFISFYTTNSPGSPRSCLRYLQVSAGAELGSHHGNEQRRRHATAVRGNLRGSNATWERPARVLCEKSYIKKKENKRKNGKLKPECNLQTCRVQLMRSLDYLLQNLQEAGHLGLIGHIETRQWQASGWSRWSDV